MHTKKCEKERKKNVEANVHRKMLQIAMVDKSHKSIKCGSDIAMATLGKGATFWSRQQNEPRKSMMEEK